MAPFSLRELLASRSGEDYDLWARDINPQFVRVLKTIDFDRIWTRAEGAYLWDKDGNRYLDMLGGFGMVNVGRNNPRVRAALAEFLELETARLGAARRDAAAGAARRGAARARAAAARALPVHEHRDGGGRGGARSSAEPRRSAAASSPSTMRSTG